MTQILIIDGDTVLVDAANIAFGTPGPPPDHPIDLAEFASVAAASPDPAPIAVAQFSAVEAAIIPPVPARIAAFAIVQVIWGNRSVVSLRGPIGLSCWQPCTTFGHLGGTYYG